MKEILKFTGAIMILIGVIILAVYYFGQSNSNTLLASSGGIMVIGLFVHVLLNRRVK